jgi:putative transposase
VEKAEDFPYSSARAHIAGARDEALGEELFKEEQREDYIKFIRLNIPEKETNSIRYYTRTGRPFGSEEFIKKMEKKLDKRFILQRPGRPKGRKN